MNFGIDKFIADPINSNISTASVQAAKEFEKAVASQVVTVPTLTESLGRMEMTFLLDKVYEKYIHLCFENTHRIHYTIRNNDGNQSGITGMNALVAFFKQGTKISSGSKYEW